MLFYHRTAASIIRFFAIFTLLWLSAANIANCQPQVFSADVLTLTTIDSITEEQDYQFIHPNKSPKIRYNRLLVCSAGLLTLNFAAYQPFKQTWWQEERTSFHLYRGWRRNTGWWDFGWGDSYYGHIDKLGHFYSSKIMSEQLTGIANWIGFDRKTSRWLGPLMSSLLMLEIEVYDGFFKEWGFSLADFTANELGAFTPLLREKIPYARYFSLKFSYHPSGQPQKEPTFIKDYAGMTYWLSCDVWQFLPGNLKKHYPRWLNFAIGYGVTKQAHGDVEIYLAPDINWEKVYSGSSETARFFFHALNYLHFPSFSLRIMPDRKFYWLYY